jgi:monovalent cation:H+ antiporter-2, CPA2 family
MSNSLLANVDVILGFAILILTIFYKFQVPPVLGFIVTGILIRSFGIEFPNMGGLSADLGVIFLLFTIGVENTYTVFWD